MKLGDLANTLQKKALETPELEVSAVVFENHDGGTVFMTVRAMRPETGKALIRMIKTMSS